MPVLRPVRCEVLLRALVLFVAATACAFAQFNSGFTGVVTDQSSAQVPAAKITVTNQATGVARTTVSTGTGDFRIPSLPGGTYSIEVQAQGFKTWVQRDVILENNQARTVNPTLALATQATTVEVAGGAEA